MFHLDNGHFPERPLLIHRIPESLATGSELFGRLETDFVFTMVRHPLRRAYSCFTEKIQRGAFRVAQEVLAQNFGNEVKSEGRTPELQRERFVSFLRFVDGTLAGSIPFQPNPHWSAQTPSIRQALAGRKIDFVGRIENFSADFGHVLEEIGADGSLAQTSLNKGDAAYGYEEIVNGEVLELGQRVYAEDFQALGYSVEGGSTSPCLPTSDETPHP